MTSQTPNCAEDGCMGAISTDGRCIAHLSSEQLLDLLSSVATSSVATRGLDARRVHLNQGALDRLLNSLLIKDGTRQMPRINFEEAIFESDAIFECVSF